MKTHLKLEELALFLLFSAIFFALPLPWWWFPVLILTPDLGMLGYLKGSSTGAWTYNLLHSRVTGVVLVAIGIPAWFLGGIVEFGWAQWANAYGFIILAHISLDRVLGYGLKYSDAFAHTHLGWLNRPEGTV